VNLFNLAGTSHVSRPRYDTEVFSAIAESYSEVAWTERSEELNAEHAMTVVNAIRKLLSGFRRHFKLDQLDKHAVSISASNQILAQIRSTVGIEKICRDLYHVGVLGQSIMLKSPRMEDDVNYKAERHETWFYRDNREFDNSEWLIVHRALFPCLKLGSLKADMFGLDPRMVYSQDL
jgi:hypothetical protein